MELQLGQIQEDISSIKPSGLVDMDEVMTFAPEDPTNPFNWSKRKKTFVVLVGVVAILNSTFDSALTSGSINYISDDFGVTEEIQLFLPISVYLIGYILGPLFFSPLSEIYGRKVVLVPTFALFTVFTAACALAKDWPSFLIFRLICGINASSSIAITSGIYSDIFEGSVARGRAIALYICSTAFGPQFAPLVSGALSSIHWRWTFWAALIIAGVSMVPIAFVPETYKPVILRRKAQSIRRQYTECRIYAPIELERKSAREIMTVVMTRPIRLFLGELLVFSSCLYLAFVSAVYFLLFEAYPLIFRGVYGFGLVSTGLAFIPIAIGSFCALPILVLWDTYFRHAQTCGCPFTTIKEYERLPLACLGAILWSISIFWLGWSSSFNVHWIVPMIAGAPFGTGFVLIFLALLNYMTDAFKEYAASVSAAAGCTRSIFGALLPLAASAMYASLGLAWGMSLLGFVSLLLGMVPFGFLYLGRRRRTRTAEAS